MAATARHGVHNDNQKSSRKKRPARGFYGDCVPDAYCHARLCGAGMCQNKTTATYLTTMAPPKTRAD